MKRVHSPATRLLHIARQRQRLCELLLARAQAMDAWALRRLADAEAARTAAERAWAAALTAGARAVVVQSSQVRLQQAMEQCRLRTQERNQTAQHVAAALADLRAQQSHTKSLERLEQRAADAHRRESFREQENWQDEQRLRRHWRQSQPEREVNHA